MLRTQIRQIIPVNRSNDRMFQIHQPDTFRHIRRLLRVQRERLASQRIAETARTRTDISRNHKGSRPSAPALSHIRTFSAGADSMQTVGFNDAFCPCELFVPTQPDF